MVADICNPSTPVAKYEAEIEELPQTNEPASLKKLLSSRNETLPQQLLKVVL